MSSSNSTDRQYLNLEALCLHELPPHPDLASVQAQSAPSLANFLQGVLAEAYRVDFDDNTWSSQGKNPSSGSVTVSMPAADSAQDRNVRVEVDKRVRGKGSSAFLGRRSIHNEGDVDYVELDSALSQDHCGKEAAYDPNIFDGNRLLEWSTEDLKIAVQELKPEWRVQKAQISMFEMFHEMPKISGLSLLEDRVFHVLCVTAHSGNPASEGQSMPHTQSHTLQLPINIESFRDVNSIVSRSHFQQKSKKYSIGNTPTERQKKHDGNSVTEGAYCSLERLRRVPDDPGKYQWDMMTRSDAKGSIRFTPSSIKNKETLEAVCKDVQYVLEYIKKLRLAARGT